MAKVVVVGLGYIGLPTAAMLALNGNDVVGVDIQPKVLEALRSGNIPVREKDLTAIVREATRSGRLQVSERPEKADYFLICVPTPKLGQKADLTAVDAASRSIHPFIRKGSTASDVTFFASNLPRSKYAPAAPATPSTTTAMVAITYFRELLETAAAGIEPELAAAADVLAEDALAEVAALPERPESRSRFSRAKSLRRSAAL